MSNQNPREGHPVPTIGRIVHYKLNEIDILKYKDDIALTGAGGNPHSIGQTVPLIVVGVYPDEYGPSVAGVNGRTILDGNALGWVTPVKEGITPGEWSWPPRT
jgi:hypothetical protein